MKKPSDIFDAVITSVPANSTAGRVTSRGEHYDPKIEVRQRKYSEIPTHADAPAKCIPIPANRPETFIDLTGQKFGRFTVIGYLGRLNPKNDKKGVWQVRCVCGNYETRKTASIKKADPQHAACAKCLAWERTKKAYEKEGARPLTDFFKRVP